MNKINWTKYFDKIYCINFIQYKDRKKAMQKQLDRVGILDHPNFQFHHTFISPYTNLIFTICKQLNICKQPKMSLARFNLSLNGHYECIKKSEINDYEKILILQDDIRFLKDLNKCQQILINMPHDANLILFDKYKNINSQFIPYNNYFNKFNTAYSAGLYMLDKKGISSIAKAYQNELTFSDWYWQDKFTSTNELKKYCCNKNSLGIQIIYQNCQNGEKGNINSINYVHNIYIQQGINYQEYNLDQNYGYGKFIQGI